MFIDFMSAFGFLYSEAIYVAHFDGGRTIEGILVQFFRPNVKKVERNQQVFKLTLRTHSCGRLSERARLKI